MHFRAATVVFAIPVLFLPQSVAYPAHLALVGGATGGIHQRTLNPDTDIVQARHIPEAPDDTLEPRIFRFFRSSKPSNSSSTAGDLNPPSSPTTRSVIRILYLAGSRCHFYISTSTRSRFSVKSALSGLRRGKRCAKLTTQAVPIAYVFLSRPWRSTSLPPPVPPIPPQPEADKCKGLYLAVHVTGRACANHIIGAKFWYPGEASQNAVPVAEVAQEPGSGTCCHNNIKNFKVITQPYFTKYVGYLL
jgi:hypothetical protein